MSDKGLKRPRGSQHSLYLPGDLGARIEDYATSRGISFSRAVTELCEAALLNSDTGRLALLDALARVQTAQNNAARLLDDARALVSGRGPITPQDDQDMPEQDTAHTTQTLPRDPPVSHITTPTAPASAKPAAQKPSIFTRK